MVAIPLIMMASCGLSPITIGNTKVAPNIATTCCAPRPTIRGQDRRSSTRTTAPGGGVLPSWTTRQLNRAMTCAPFEEPPRVPATARRGRCRIAATMPCCREELNSRSSTRRRAGGPQPQRGPGRLHGPVDHGQQLAVQGVQVDLVAEAGREVLDGPGGVVAAAVEAPVDHGLDAAAQGLEGGGHGQGGGGHGEAGSPAPARRPGRAGRRPARPPTASPTSASGARAATRWG